MSWSFALGNGTIALVIVLAVLVGWPVRSWILDLPSLALAGLMLVSAVGLVRASSWRLQALRVAAGAGMFVGLVAALALAIAASYLIIAQGPRLYDGRTLVLITALVLPYMLLYPGAQLLWVHRQLSPQIPSG